MFSTQTIAEKNFYFPFIDGLRGIAVIMVLMVHTSQYVGNDYPGSFSFKLSEFIVNGGARGVQLFFILSAFTLFSSSRARYHIDTYPKIDFYLRRAFRIFPFWFLMVLYMAFVTGTVHDIKRIILNLTFVFGFIRFIPNIELVSPAWSLFVEETFYLMLPFLFLYIKNIYLAFKLFLITLLLAVLWLFSAYKIGIPNTGEFIFLFPFSQWFVFAIGITLYFLINSQNFKKLVLNVPANYLVLDSLAIITFFLGIVNTSRWGWMIVTFSFVFLFIASVPEKSICGRLARMKLMMRFGVIAFQFIYSIFLY